MAIVCCCLLSQEGSVLVSAVEPHDYTTRLPLIEESKSLAWAAVWDSYCDSRKVLTWLKRAML